MKQIKTQENSKMCGITGFWDFLKNKSLETQTTYLHKMTDSIAHRGPDSFGYWQDEKSDLHFGHRRLAIVDLSANGHQPMISQNNRYVLIYNGEVYNSAILRSKLETEGLSFKGHSDTEIILEAFSLWGLDETLALMVGMFALALWDKQTETLFLIRDRVGVKPLYWSIQNNVLLFGSELKTLQQHPAFETKKNQEALSHYLTYGFIPTPLSIYENTHKCKPGTYLAIKNPSDIKEIAYWSLYDKAIDGLKKPLQSSFEKNMTSLEAILDTAISSRMVADVPLGCFLSGGIDSSLVAAIMQKHSSKPIQTFSIGFDQKSFNEAPYAKAIANHLGTDHHEYIFKPQEALDLMIKIPEWFDEPFADSSCLPTYLVSKMARQNVTVALSGDGGDEFFAGYNRYLFAGKHGGKIKNIPSPFKTLFKHILQSLSPKQWDALSTILHKKIRPNHFGEKVMKLIPLLQAESTQDLYRRCVSLPHQHSFLKDPNTPSPSFAFDNAMANINTIEAMQIYDALFYMMDDVLVKVDRASMATGLEAREPLLDHRLIEFSFKLPMDQKIRGNQGKIPLRHILHKYVPKALFERPKAGFAIPVAEWLKTDLRDMAEECFSPHTLSQMPELHSTHIQAEWHAFKKGQTQLAHHLWALLIYQLGAKG